MSLYLLYKNLLIKPQCKVASPFHTVLRNFFLFLKSGFLQNLKEPSILLMTKTFKEIPHFIRNDMVERIDTVEIWK